MPEALSIKTISEQVDATQPILSVEGLSVDFEDRYGRAKRALNEISFSINAGETLVLLGQSGSGKSITAMSLLRTLPLNARIRSGRVVLAGKELLRATEAEVRSLRGKNMGMIFQEPQTCLNPVIRIGDQLAEVIRLHDPHLRSRQEIRARAIELLEAVGIPKAAMRLADYPHQFSGGMKQRAMIAIALAGRPQLLIADEPTTALDVTIQAQILELLDELRARTNLAILLITHNLGVAADIADQVAVMHEGQIIEAAPAETFFNAPHHPQTQALFRSLPSIKRRTQSLSGKALEDVELQTEKNNKKAEGQTLKVADLQIAYANNRWFGEQPEPVVKGVSFELVAGKTLALVGESGCGKTSIARAILGFIKPTSGTITYAGKDLTKTQQMKLLRRTIQIVFQDSFAAMDPRMRILDVVTEGLLRLGIMKSPAARYERAVALLEMVGLNKDMLDRYPHEFSGGQRQRLCIARALAVEPQILICDEPTSALDVQVQAQVLDLLKDLQRRLGLSYLFISHDISVVSWLADEVLVMQAGRIVERGPVEQVIAHPQQEYTRKLMAAVPGIDKLVR